MGTSRSALTLDVSPVLRHLGQRVEVTRDVSLDGLEVSDARVPAGASLRLVAEVESTASGAVSVTGTIRAPWEGTCRRCLGPVAGEVTAEVAEVFERNPTEGDTYPLVEDTIDLEPLVRDAVLLALPIAPLCTDDCQGPDPQDFPVTPEVDPDDVPEPADRPKDPRWSALDQLNDP